jgi:protein O-GlcNAc transferase
MSNPKITVQYKGFITQSVAVNPRQLLQQAFRLYQQRNMKEAHALCVRFLEKEPQNFDALQLMGAIAMDTKNYAASVHFYTLSLQVIPSDAHSHRNRGMAFEGQGQLEAAIADYYKAVALKQDFADTYYSLGNLHARRGEHTESLQNYDSAIQLNPNLNYIHGSRLMEAMRVCLWDRYAEQLSYISTGILNGAKVSPPFAISTLGDDPQVQKDAALIWARNEYPPNGALGAFVQKPRREKIRVGYFSTDFRNHPVAYLTAEMFELHDKNLFEIIAFSFSARVDDEMQNRLRQSFDAFHDVSEMGDAQIADLARSQGIDIAIDLGGYTVNNRFGVFSFRAAPIQAGYIGYLGTTGAPNMDYILADQTIIPPESRENYSEKVVYLPCYQVNDSGSKLADEPLPREVFKLPQDKFVFCCFNSVYKINPSVFDSWMRILKGSSDSVLFLAPDNPQAESHLKQEAHRRGVDPDRIVFSQRLPRPAFLARFKAANLFLDTWPCNAGTTASESLWSGLPVLTLQGQTFASRIGASLLMAMELPELITKSQDQYERLAIELSQNPAKLLSIADKLEHQKSTAPLFNTKLFTTQLETAYKKMFDRYQSGAPPDHVVIEA